MIVVLFIKLPSVPISYITALVVSWTRVVFEGEFFLKTSFRAITSRSPRRAKVRVGVSRYGDNRNTRATWETTVVFDGDTQTEENPSLYYISNCTVDDELFMVSRYCYPPLFSGRTATAEDEIRYCVQ